LWIKKQEGASKEDIEQLSKFKFRRVESNEKQTDSIQEPAGGIMTECRADSPIEHVLAEEDAVCYKHLLLDSHFALFLIRFYFTIFQWEIYVMFQTQTSLHSIVFCFCVCLCVSQF
jgi:hypothetical protein